MAHLHLKLGTQVDSHIYQTIQDELIVNCNQHQPGKKVFDLSVEICKEA